jgi:hypothetical protein
MKRRGKIMSNFEVIHARKIKSIVGSIEVIKHNLRKKNNLDEFIDETKSIFNYYDGVNEKNFIKKYNEATKNLSRKIQKNASKLIEIVISFSHEYGVGWENNPKLKKKIKEYFNASKKIFKKRYGDFIILRTDHFDEMTPHSHFLIVPICVNKDGKRRFTSSEFLGGKKGLFDLHDQFYKEVGVKFELERGVRDSRTSHSDLKSYKEWEKSQRITIENLKEQLNKKNEIIVEQQKNLFRLNGEILKKTASLSNREKEIDEIEKNLNEQVPQIPIPPATVIENSRIKWKDEIQNVVNTAFKKINEAFISLKIKYDNLCEKYNTLKTQNDKNKKRAEKAEKDLLEMSIEEISAVRELRKKNEAKQTDNQKRSGKSHDKR